jgi:hypothetical protein
VNYLPERYRTILQNALSQHEVRYNHSKELPRPKNSILSPLKVHPEMSERL